MPKGEMPISCNLFSRISRLMVSNALLISNNTTAVTFFLFMPLMMVWAVFLVTTLRRRLSFIRLQIRHELTESNSITYLRKNGQKMGLLLFVSSCSPSFKIGETSAIFPARGKMPLVGEAFITDFNNRQDGGEAVFNHASREFINPRWIL